MWILRLWQRADDPTRARDRRMECVISAEEAHTQKQREEAESARRRLEALIDIKSTVSSDLLPRASRK